MPTEISELKIEERTPGKILGVNISFLGVATLFLTYWPTMQEYILQWLPSPWGQMLVIILGAVASLLALFVNPGKFILTKPADKNYLNLT